MKVVRGQDAVFAAGDRVQVGLTSGGRSDVERAGRATVMVGDKFQFLEGFDYLRASGQLRRQALSLAQGGVGEGGHRQQAGVR